MNMIDLYYCLEWILRNMFSDAQLNITVQYFIWLLSQENPMSDTDAAYVAIYVACVWKS